MTDLRYGGASPSPTSPSPAAAPRLPAPLPGWVVPVKVLTSMALVGSFLAAAAVAGFIATIVYSGCFLSCTGRNEVGGLLLWALAAVLVLAGPALSVLMWRTARSVQATAIWGAVVLGGPALWIILGVGSSALGSF